MMEIGRLCMKIAGRDAGKKAVIIKKLDEQHVLIDGETRRRKCNITHLEPLKEKIEIKEDASHDEVKTAFQKLGIKLKDKVVKEKKAKKPEEKEIKTAGKNEKEKKKQDKPAK